MPAGPALRAGLPGRHREMQHAVRTQPAQDLHGQASEAAGQPHRVIPGVEDNQDGRVTLAPVPGSNQPGDDAADLRGCHLCLVVIGAQPDRAGTAVQDVRPGSRAAMTEYGQPGIICAWPVPRPQAWQNSLSGLAAAPGRSQLLTSAAS